MRPRKKDPAFLHMAAVAAIGGCMAIVFSIGFPLWAIHHGRPYTPAFSLFAAWGVAALAGAFACLHTYRLSDDLAPRPPGGGVRLEFRKHADTMPAQSDASDASQRRAA